MITDARETVRRLLVEVWGRGDLAALPELAAEDLVAHLASRPDPIVGLESYRGFVATYQAVLGNAHFEIEDQLVDGDRIATRWRAHPAGGAATDAVMGISMARIGADGRVVETWDTYDLMSLLSAAEDPDALEKLSLRL